jgi:hypothetical protein
MGVYSTLDVNREYALNKIYEKLEKATNEELSEVLFELHGRKVLYNYTVWDDSVDIDP